MRAFISYTSYFILKQNNWDMALEHGYTCSFIMFFWQIQSFVSYFFNVPLCLQTHLTTSVPELSWFQITAISAIRCPFPPASRCLSEIKTAGNTCSPSMGVWVRLIFSGKEKRKEGRRIPPALQELSGTAGNVKGRINANGGRSSKMQIGKTSTTL